MKLIIKSIPFLLLFICTQVFAQTGAVLQLEQEEFNFGKVNQGEIVRYTFKFKNTGDAALVLSDVKPSCGCTATHWKKTPTQPGESGEIELSFNTAGKMGPQKKSVTINSNAGMKLLYIVGDVYSHAPETGK